MDETGRGIPGIPRHRTPTHQADSGFTGWKIVAVAGAAVLVTALALWVAPSSQSITPGCTDTSTACQQRRLTAIEKAITALQSPQATLPPTTPPATTAPPSSPPPTTPPPSPTPTTPTPTSSTGCFWPACFPTAANTGPTGTLTPSTGDRTISTGTLTNTAVSGVIRVNGGTTASPVVIRNSSARGVVGCSNCVYSIEDSLIDGINGAVPSGAQALVQGGSFTLLRSEVIRGADLVRLDGSNKQTIIRDSFLHNIYHSAGDHGDAIQYFSGGGANIVIDHNSVDSRAGNDQDSGNAAVFLADDPAGIKVNMTHNLWAGGNSPVRLHDARSGSRNVYLFDQNTILSGSYSVGPCNLRFSVPFDGISGYTWTSNVFSNGVALPASLCGS